MKTVRFEYYGVRPFSIYVASARHTNEEMSKEDAIRINEWLKANAHRMDARDWGLIDVDDLADPAGSIIALFQDEELAMEFKLMFTGDDIKP